MRMRHIVVMALATARDASRTEYAVSVTTDVVAAERIKGVRVRMRGHLSLGDGGFACAPRRRLRGVRATSTSADLIRPLR